MAWFPRRGRPPADVLSGAADALHEQPHSLNRRVMGWGHGDGVDVLVLSDALVVRRDAGWTATPWQQIQRGSWDGREHLTVTLLDGTAMDLRLTDPGRVPGLFQERVETSILVERRIEVPGGEVLLSGRRSPDPSRAEPVLWHALSVGRVDLSDPSVSAAVVQATDKLRADYEI